MTKEWKYTYWWYGDSEMKPTEELFHLTRDPLEMTNLADSPEATPMLDSIRKTYNVELAKEQVVPYNNCERYGTLFDRSIPWNQKKLKRPRSEQNPVDAAERAERKKRRQKAAQ